MSFKKFAAAERVVIKDSSTELPKTAETSDQQDKAVDPVDEAQAPEPPISKS